MYQQVLYLSQTACPSGYRHLPTIAAGARRYNASAGIRAALLFDGWRFCQLLQGPHEPLEALLQRLQSDPRHTALRLLHRRGLPALQPADVWRLGDWVQGYCEAEELDAYDVSTSLCDEAALARFHHILLRADLRP